MKVRGAESWEEWLKKHRALLEANAPYEWQFAEQVLRRVPGLAPSSVHPQEAFTDWDGEDRRMDFALVENNVRIAIEVDGYDKRGRGSGMTHAEFADFLRRQNSLSGEGWTVLRFCNTDVEDHSNRCVRDVKRALKSARAAAAKLRATTSEHEAATRDPRRRTVKAVAAIIVIAVLVGPCLYPTRTRDDQLGVSPFGNECPRDAPIKGNHSIRNSEAIYHMPGGEFYEATTPERCFASEDSAEAAGFRRSRR